MHTLIATKQLKQGEYQEIHTGLTEKQMIKKYKELTKKGFKVEKSH